MKRILLNLALLVVAVAVPTSVQASYRVVTLEKAGTLKSKVGSDYKELDSLRVEGPMNFDDVRVGWKCAYEGKLKFFDMEKGRFENNKMPDYAFYAKGNQKGFLYIDEIVLPDNLEEIGEYAFMYTYLYRMPIPSTVRKLNKGSFNTCNLAWEGRAPELQLPEGITEIPDSCFFGSINGEYLNLPSTLTRIGKQAFANCYIHNLKLPANLESVDDFAFYGSPIFTVEFTGTCRTIGEQAFNGCEFIESIILPNDLEEVPYGFCGHSHLTEIEIPASVKAIRESAFGINHKLHTVVLHEGLESIGKMAFYGCESLKNIVIPSTVTSLSNDLKVAKLYSKPTVPPQLSLDGGANKSITVYVRQGSKTLYENSSEWSLLAKEIVELSDEEMELAAIGEVNADAETDATFTVAAGGVEVRPSSGKSVNFTVVSIEGQTVASGVASSNRFISLAPGIYIISTERTALKFLVK